MAGDAELKEAMVKVAGNCEMCQARIEKAARSVSGVSEASWDKESKILTLQFDAAKTATEAVEKAVAAAGHDTANHAAHKDDYGDLPACCKYERIHNQ
jgi:copper chaperone CopZ